MIRIFKKLLVSQIISLQCLLKGNEKETESSADYHLSIVRKKEEKAREVVKTNTEQEKGVGEVQRKELLVRKKALVWDPRVQNGLLTASQLFNINQWLLSLENQQPYDLQDVIESTNDEVDPAVDELDKMLDSFQDFGDSKITRRLTTLV